MGGVWTLLYKQNLHTSDIFSVGSLISYMCFFVMIKSLVYLFCIFATGILCFERGCAFIEYSLNLLCIQGEFCKKVFFAFFLYGAVLWRWRRKPYMV